jgi:biopolymer transport protein ExbD
VIAMSEDRADINVTPLIDVMLVLLIITKRDQPSSRNTRNP